MGTQSETWAVLLKQLTSGDILPNNYGREVLINKLVTLEKILTKMKDKFPRQDFSPADLFDILNTVHSVTEWDISEGTYNKMIREFLEIRARETGNEDNHISLISNRSANERARNLPEVGTFSWWFWPFLGMKGGF